MQNCEKTETNLQVMTKGNQIKNFSKKRFKTSQTRLQHTQAVEKTPILQSNKDQSQKA